MPTTLSLSAACYTAEPRPAHHEAFDCGASATSDDSSQDTLTSHGSHPDLHDATWDQAHARQAKRSRFHVVEPLSLKPPADRRFHVLVYGSLLPGLHNHRVIEKSEFLGYHRTEAKYDMFSLGTYPAVCKDGNTAILGALYCVSAATLGALDALEGHPHYYRREAVKIATAGDMHAHMYLLGRHEPEIHASDRVPSGNWREHLAAQKAKPSPHSAPAACTTMGKVDSPFASQAQVPWASVADAAG